MINIEQDHVEQGDAKVLDVKAHQQKNYLGLQCPLRLQRESEKVN